MKTLNNFTIKEISNEVIMFVSSVLLVPVCKIRVLAISDDEIGFAGDEDEPDALLYRGALVKVDGKLYEAFIYVCQCCGEITCQMNSKKPLANVEQFFNEED